jgi:hypothetical protein
MSWFILVGDDSGHKYVIPEDKREEWWDFIDAEDYDVEFPSYATMVEGSFRFKEWEG